jgi:hypothetical protein
MHDVTVPPPVEIRHPVTKELVPIDGSTEPWELFRYLATVVIPDPGMGRGYKADKIRMDLETLFAKDENRRPGAIVGVEDEPWETMKKVIEKPGGEVPPTLTRSCLSHQAAIVEAPKRSV